MFKLVMPSEQIVRAAWMQGFAAGALCVLVLVVLVLLLKERQ